MKKNKQLGIWMDHSNAYIMEFVDNTIVENIITSEFSHQDKELSLSKGENSMHTKEQHLQKDYFKKLSDIIINFDEVVLFGPTDAKSELFNSIKSNHLFEGITIEVKQSDKMTAIQMHDFVIEYFK